MALNRDIEEGIEELTSSLQQQLSWIMLDRRSKISSKEDGRPRIIGAIDVDSFECQIWLRKFPKYKGHPCVVADRSGRLLSASPEAKIAGISRADHRVNDARMICPNLHVFVKPNRFNKPDCEETLLASWELTDIIHQTLPNQNIKIEHVPSDQWYFDFTEWYPSYTQPVLQICATQVLYQNKSAKIVLENEKQYIGQEILDDYLKKGYFDYEESKNLRLLAAAWLLNLLSDFIFKATGFSCSGGVGPNLMMAKVACNLNKPGKVTVLSEKAWNRLCPEIAIGSVRGFGNKLGKNIEHTFGIQFMDQLQKIALSQLQETFPPEDVLKIINASQGSCDIIVQDKTATDVVSCGKYNLNINSYSELKRELDTRCKEMLDRLKKDRKRYRREPTSYQVCIGLQNKIDQECRSEKITIKPSTVSDLAEEFFNEIVLKKVDLYRTYQVTSLKLTAKGFKLIQLALSVDANAFSSTWAWKPSILNLSRFMYIFDQKSLYSNIKLY